MTPKILKKLFSYRLSLIASRQSGFTIIEMVVSVSVFAIAVTSMVGVYISVQRLNAESASMNIVQQTGRIILEDLTKIVRNGQIDYASYVSNYGASGAPQPSVDTLYLINELGENVEISKSANNLLLTKNGTTSSRMNANEVDILDFNVYVWPATDPFSGGSTREQPTVTIFLELQSDINDRDVVTVPFQTTASTRQYPE